MLLLGASLFIGGCAFTKPSERNSTANPDFNAHTAAVLAHSNWQLEGRLNIRQQKESDTVSIHWQQQGNRFALTLSSTVLGLGTTRVQGDDNGVTVESAGAEPLHVPDLQTALRDYLGFNFPAANLRFWVRGLPVPGWVATTEFDQNLQLATLLQADAAGQLWRLEYDRYGLVEGLALPGRIRLTANALQLTVLIQQWQFGPSR